MSLILFNVDLCLVGSVSTRWPDFHLSRDKTTRLGCMCHVTSPVLSEWHFCVCTEFTAATRSTYSLSVNTDNQKDWRKSRGWQELKQGKRELSIYIPFPVESYSSCLPYHFFTGTKLSNWTWSPGEEEMIWNKQNITFLGPTVICHTTYIT